MKHAVIITGGELSLPFARRVLASIEEPFFIAVDGGLAPFDALGVTPDVMVGDFDTIDPDTFREYEARGIKTLRHPPEKDDTDTELALKTALSFSEVGRVTILGALGRRFDHALANVEILLTALKAGLPCEILDPCNRIRLLGGYTEFSEENAFGKYISFIPFTDAVTGLTLKGFKYPLDRAVMRKGVSLGISNERTEASAYADFEEGILICIESRDKEEE